MATVLIEDPDPATCSLLELLLLRLGHRPVGRSELAEGERPDLLLLEPASGAGVRQARALRDRFPRLPILCVSIEPPSEESQLLDPLDHVMKPFRRDRLEAALRQAFPPAPAGLEASA